MTTCLLFESKSNSKYSDCYYCVYSLTVVSNISYFKWYQAEGIHGWDETYNKILRERKREKVSKEGAAKRITAIQVIVVHAWN